MAMRAGARLSPPLQDENSRKAPGAGGHGGGLKISGLKPQQPNERKILSDISNKLQPLVSKSGAGTPISIHRGDKEDVNIGGGKAGGPRFGIRVDADLAHSKPGFPIPSAKVVELQQSKAGLSGSSATEDRAPLNDINCSENSGRSHFPSPKSLKQKATDVQNEASTKFKFPPPGKLKLSEEMKKNAARWAEEGIEHVHFSGQDMEALAAKIEKEEMEKRIAQVLSYRTDLPLPRCLPVEATFWDFPDVLQLDPVQEFEDDEYQWPVLEGLKLEVDFEDQLLGYIDPPPSLPEGWPQVLEDSLTETD